LAFTLETQIRLRDGAIAHQEAIACLREMGGAKTVNQSGIAQLEGAASEHTKLQRPRRHGIRLGELLVLAGVLSEMDVMNALEFSLVTEKQLGQVLIEHGYITKELCETALKLQSLVDSGNLDCEQAAASLKSVYNGNLGLLQAMESVTSATDEGTYVDFQSLLIESQLMSQEEVQAAMELAVSNPRLMTKILLMTGYLDEARAEVILACYDALIKNKISWQDALNMLTYSWQCLKEGTASLDQLLQKLNLPKLVDSNTDNFTDKRSEFITPSTASTSPNKHTGKTTAGIPALSLLQAESNLLQPTGQPTTSPPLPRSNPGGRTGKTTANVPALNPLMTGIAAGSELLRPDALPPVPARSAPLKRSSPKQSFSLKSLLTSQEMPALPDTEPQPDDKE
jgi:hypothetical protein